MGLFKKIVGAATGKLSPQGAIGGQGRTGGAVGVPYEFAFVDVETTGLDASTDRIIELAIVVTDGLGVMRDSWVTLVNPGTGDAGPTRIHQIESEWLLAAPDFASLTGDIASRLNHRFLVAHNTRFDVDFLEAEFERAGQPIGHAPFPTLDTMELAEKLGLPRKLEFACAQLGYSYEGHNALDDALACAELFHRQMPFVEPSTFKAARPVPLPISQAPSGAVVVRQEAATKVRPRSVLSEFTQYLYPEDPDRPRDEEGAKVYRALVVSAIEDGYIDEGEKHAMASIAHANKLSANDVAEIHHELVLAMVNQALADNKMSQAEQAEIRRAATWLDVDVSDWKTIVAAARKRVKAARKEFSERIEGRNVVFVGRGVHPNNIRKALAESHGAVVGSRYAAKTDLLIIGSADLDNKSVENARRDGTEIIVEQTFWQRLGEI